MSNSVVVIDYGLGNIRSIAAAIQRTGYQCNVSSDPRVIESAKKLILPGVGAFGDGMQNIRSRGLKSILDKKVLKDCTPILGICLGAQLLCLDSSEFGHHCGLGWLKASVVKLDPPNGLRVPHVGWNDLNQVRQSPLLDGVPTGALVYYVHSYHIVPSDAREIIATCTYGMEFVAALQHDNIFATQFHPEKSQLHGLQILRNFLQLNFDSYGA